MGNTNDDFDAAFAQAANARAQPATDPLLPDADAAGGSAATGTAPGHGDTSDPHAAQEPGAAVRIAELEAALAEALHRERSVTGRISTSDRRSAELERQVRALTATVESLRAAKPAAPTAGNADDILSKTPDLADAVARRIEEAAAPLRAALDTANARLASAGEQVEEPLPGPRAAAAPPTAEAVAETLQQLDAEFTPAWRQHVRSLTFAQWLRDQPAAIQAAYDDANTFAESAPVLMQFYRAQPAMRTTREQWAARAQAGNDGGGRAPTGTGSRQRQPRDRLVAAAGLAPRASAAAPAQLADDFDGAFAEAAAQVKGGR